MRCVRCWTKYRFLVYPISCWVLMAATAYTVYSIAGRQTDEQGPRTTQSQTSMVLVVAYMRSGSSFLGDILQQYEPSFYVYEPLKFASDKADNNQSIALFNGSERYVQTPEERVSFFVETLYNWFTCNFNALDLGTLTSSYLLYYSKMTRTYSGCLRRYNRTTTTQYRIQNCVHHLQATCIPAKLRVIKCVRIDMDTVHLLQQRLSSLKVIHIIRDPRAMMNSMVKVKLSNWINLDTEVTDLCRRMTNNIEMAAQMNENYVAQIIYELVAEHPMVMAEDIYKFAGLELSLTARKGVYRLSHYTPLARDCDWCTKKSNSTKTSLMWRTQIDLGHAMTIDASCVDLYKAVGYLPVEDIHQLRDLSIPLRLMILPPGPL